jgi:hypothetical protein
VVVAVIAVRMVQMTVDEVIHMITVRHRLVPAIGAVNVARLVTGTLVRRRAGVWVGVRHFQNMLFDFTVFANVMQMTVVNIVDMVAMLDTGVFAIGTMLVIMMGVQLRHCFGSFKKILGQCVPSRA